MRRAARQILAGVVVLLLLSTVATATAPAADESTTDLAKVPAWVYTLTWPAALVILGLSPIGRALASLIDRWAPAKKDQGAAGGSDKTLQDIAQTLKVTAELQREQGAVLGKLNDGITVLLERTR